MRVSVESADAALAQAVLLYDRASSDVRRAINAETRQARGWVRDEVTRHAVTRLDRHMTRTVKVQAGQQLTVTMGTTGQLKGTGHGPKTPNKDLVRPVEFGYKDDTVRTYTRVYRGSRAKGAGRPHTVTRHTRRQLPKAVDPPGRMMYRALPVIAPRLLAQWIRAVAALFDPDRTRSR